METKLAEFIRDSADGIEADGILRKCVHCGFCTATCPTYQLLGDELDGPRGRIYLIKQVLEGRAPTRKTQLHLDRCLTCRNCETTCPSGVEYGRLLDIGRATVESQIGTTRPLTERLTHSVLRETLSRRRIFSPALALGRAVRPFLPAKLSAKIPRRARLPAAPPARHARRMLVLEGCVQPALAPGINRAASRVFDRLGITLIAAAGERCCGALRAHLHDHPGAMREARANIDAWIALLDSGVEAIVSTASGCGVTVQDYGRLFADDKAYRDAAQRVSAATADVATILARFTDELAALATQHAPDELAYHPPCTLQHGQRVRGTVEAVLAAVGVTARLCANSHLCCGSAGTYSILQADLATQLRDAKLAALDEVPGSQIVSANVGCIAHLGSASRRTVRHWIEVLDERTSAPAPMS